MSGRESAKQKLARLEGEIKKRGVRLGYERLQFAGLMLKGGLCWFKGQYYLFVDRRKKPSERLDQLEAALEELNRLAAEGRLDRPYDEDSSSGEEHDAHAG